MHSYADCKYRSKFSAIRVEDTCRACLLLGCIPSMLCKLCPNPNLPAKQIHYIGKGEYGALIGIDFRTAGQL